MDDWRTFLYPLGFLSSLFFCARILIQWIASEIKQKSVVPKIFWQLSFLGNLSLIIHSLIQIQYHVFIIQIGNALISARNLNLEKPKQSQIRLKNVILLFILTLISSSALFFILNDLSFTDLSNWFRLPHFPWQKETAKPIPFLWHVMGFIGLGLFSSRFWVQWIYAEKEEAAGLSSYFWWVSLIGDLLILIYFAKIKDPVNLIGPSFGLIPYIRNLVLLKKCKQVSLEASKT